MARAQAWGLSSLRLLRQLLSACVACGEYASVWIGAVLWHGRGRGSPAAAAAALLSQSNARRDEQRERRRREERKQEQAEAQRRHEGRPPRWIAERMGMRRLLNVLGLTLASLHYG